MIFRGRKFFECAPFLGVLPEFVRQLHNVLVRDFRRTPPRRDVSNMPVQPAIEIRDRPTLRLRADGLGSGLHRFRLPCGSAAAVARRVLGLRSRRVLASMFSDAPNPILLGRAAGSVWNQAHGCWPNAVKHRASLSIRFSFG